MRLPPISEVMQPKLHNSLTNRTLEVAGVETDIGRNGEPIRWESGDVFVEAQSRQIAREFKTSRPRPRNRAMGFYVSFYGERGTRFIEL